MSGHYLLHIDNAEALRGDTEGSFVQLSLIVLLSHS